MEQCPSRPLPAGDDLGIVNGANEDPEDQAQNRAMEVDSAYEPVNNRHTNPRIDPKETRSLSPATAQIDQLKLLQLQRLESLSLRQYIANLHHQIANLEHQLGADPLSFESATVFQTQCNTTLSGELRSPHLTRQATLEAVRQSQSSPIATTKEVIKALKKENAELKKDLDDAKSHIFRLQPNLRELTLDEAGRDFDDLVDGVSEWVQDRVWRFNNDNEAFKRYTVAAESAPGAAFRLLDELIRWDDLVYGCKWPGTDVDVIVALVMRFLDNGIFQKTFVANSMVRGELIEAIETSMSERVDTPREPMLIRTWRAETIYAILHHPEYQQQRQQASRELATRLTRILEVFHKDSDSHDLRETCLAKAIMPALSLHEKFLFSTKYFFVDLKPLVVRSKGGGPRTFHCTPGWKSDLKNMKCENILDHRKIMKGPDLMLAPHGAADSHNNVVSVMTLIPALKMRQVGKDGVMTPPVIVRPQHELVTCGSLEQRREGRRAGSGTFMNWLHDSYGPSWYDTAT